MEELNPQFKIKQDLSISMLAANLYALAFGLPILLLNIGLFFLLWDFRDQAKDIDIALSALIIFPVMLIGIVLHEYIHGISWRIIGKIPKEQIKFGFQKETLTPYAHSKVPLKAGTYRWGALMPCIVLGVVPSIIGLAAGSFAFLLYGSIFIIAAGGDLAIVWTVRGVKSDDYVQDHPERAGCYVLEEAH